MSLFTTSVCAQTVTITNSYANCRDKAGAANKYMGKVSYGQTYELLGAAKAPNNKVWYLIDKAGVPVYICSAFARKNSEAQQAQKTEGEQTLKITKSCNVRSAAGQNNKLLGRANYGNTYVVTGQRAAPNGKLWYEIQYKNSTKGWVCSSFARTSGTTNTTNSQNTAINSVTNSGSSSPYKLSDKERELVERCVTTEAGGEPYDGQLAVAQVILNRAIRNSQTVTQVITAPNQFAYRCDRKTTQSVKNAVSEVFDSGKTVLPNDTIYFCAPKYMSSKSYSDFCKGKDKVDQIGVHVFFRKK